MITAMPRIAIATPDFDGIVRTFRDTFGMPVVDLSAGSVKSLGAKLAMCVPPGGSNIELMSPADPTTPLSQSLQKFLDRRGDGLFALMLEAPDPNAEADVLQDRGLNVLPLMGGAGGRDVHPRSTHGVLIRVYPVNSFRAAAGATQTNTAQTLGLSGIVRVVIAVSDIDRAARVYAGGLGIEAGNPSVDPVRGVATVTCKPPAGGVIELVAAVDKRQPFAAAIAAHLAAHGEGMFALVLQSADPTNAAAALAARGIVAKPLAGFANTVEIDRDAIFGARILIEPTVAA